MFPEINTFSSATVDYNTIIYLILIQIVYCMIKLVRFEHELGCESSHFFFHMVLDLNAATSFELPPHKRKTVHMHINFN